MIKQSLICLSLLVFGVSGTAQAETVPYYAVHHKSKWEKLAEKEAKKISSRPNVIYSKGVGSEKNGRSSQAIPLDIAGWRKRIWRVCYDFF